MKFIYIVHIIIYTDDVIVTSDPKMSTSNNLYDEANR